MTRGVPVHPETRAEVVRLIRAELARNEIARRTGVSTATVSRIAEAEGLSFDRSQTSAATKARSVDLAALRLELAEEMASAARDMLRSRDKPYLVYNFGGKDNTYEEHTLDSAPVEVKRSIVVTAGIAFDKLTRIVERDGGGLEQAVGVIDTLAEGFRAAAEQIRAEGGADAAE
jgi:transposase-like protein